jgi:hypothetical protein
MGRYDDAEIGDEQRAWWATRARRAGSWVAAVLGASIVVLANLPGQPGGVRLAVTPLGLALAVGFGLLGRRCGRRPVFVLGQGWIRLWTGPVINDDDVASVTILHSPRGWFVVVRPRGGAGGMAPIGLLRWEDRFAIRDELRRRYQRQGVTFVDSLA